mmetsp:Transcript_41800/g.95349  ORF Transcript_41800/g.95349 Transcript_41800/m.95349 type:complete len:204 (-) Transcript_41800:1064-1675(-)
MCLEGGRRHDAGDYPDAQGLGEERGGGARWEWGAAQSEDPRYFQGGPGDFLQPLVERPQHRGGARDPRRHREPHAGACLVRRPDDDAQGPVPVADDRGGEERVGGVHLPLTRGAREPKLPPRDVQGAGAAAHGQHPHHRTRHGARGDVRRDFQVVHHRALDLLLRGQGPPRGNAHGARADGEVGQGASAGCQHLPRVGRGPSG